MSNTPIFDSKVKALLDAVEPGEKTCALLGTKWTMTEEEIGWCKKFNVPPSTMAPMTRLRQLAGFAGGISIWWKPHAETAKLILSFVHPDNPFQVIHDREWFGKDFVNGFFWDANKNFFDQFRGLAHTIPVGSTRDDGSNIETIGIDLVGCEGCYMAFGSGEAKRMYYSYMAGTRSEDCLDLTNSVRCRETFQADWSDELFQCVQAFRSTQCLQSAFIFDCQDCEFCFGATNKRHKKYLWFNEQLSKEEWERRRAEVDLSIYSVWQAHLARFEEMIRQTAWQDVDHTGCTDCQGEYLVKCTRCQESWWAILSTDLFHCWASLHQTTSAFCVWAGWGSDGYQSCDLVSSQNVKFCVRVWRSINVEYSSDCYECQNCFGCFGLRHKSFCIFNNQYGEADYWQKLDEIKCAMLDRGEYGMTFPGDLSQSGFQFSMGKMYFDYSPEEYTAFQAPHFDPARGAVVMPIVTNPEEAIQVGDIPDALDDVDPAVFVGKPIHDAALNRNFSVTPQEFAFYKAHRLPFPREHFLIRLKKLARHSNTPVKMENTCFDCGKPVTTYVNNLFTERHVYCREDYLKFIEQNG